MNALLPPRTGYTRTEYNLRPLRSIEYDILAHVTRQLVTAWSRRKANFPDLVSALNDNLALWSALATDVAIPGNQLPASLRSQIFYLYEFTDHHTRGVLKDSLGIEPLVDINMAIMRGLRGEGGEG